MYHCSHSFLIHKTAIMTESSQASEDRTSIKLESLNLSPTVGETRTSVVSLGMPSLASFTEEDDLPSRSLRGDERPSTMLTIPGDDWDTDEDYSDDDDVALPPHIIGLQISEHAKPGKNLSALYVSADNLVKEKPEMQQEARWSDSSPSTINARKRLGSKRESRAERESRKGTDYSPSPPKHFDDDSDYDELMKAATPPTRPTRQQSKEMPLRDSKTTSPTSASPDSRSPPTKPERKLSTDILQAQLPDLVLSPTAMPPIKPMRKITRGSIPTIQQSPGQMAKPPVKPVRQETLEDPLVLGTRQASGGYASLKAPNHKPSSKRSSNLSLIDED
jgi:hypothetical protein